MSFEDIAQAIEAADWERNQKRTERKTYKAGEAGYGPAECVTCEDDMPAVRREYGFTQCVHCADQAQRRAKPQFISRRVI